MTIVITDETTRAEIIEALDNLSKGAGLMRRKGYIGTASAAYARQHERIDALLLELERAKV